MVVVLGELLCILDVYTGGQMPKRITKQVFDEIDRLLVLGGHTHTEIAATVGVESSLVSTIARGRHHYQLYSATISCRPRYLHRGESPSRCDRNCRR